jgi:hypothetical protein
VAQQAPRLLDRLVKVQSPRPGLHVYYRCMEFGGSLQGYQVIRVLQNYADGTGRGRLKVDATTNVSRPIRGLLVSTGEDIPEHSASVVARSVVVPVPQAAKDLERGARCIKECQNYCLGSG